MNEPTIKKCWLIAARLAALSCHPTSNIRRRRKCRTANDLELEIMPYAKAKKKILYFHDIFEWNLITVYDFERSAIIILWFRPIWGAYQRFDGPSKGNTNDSLITTIYHNRWILRRKRGDNVKTIFRLIFGQKGTLNYLRMRTYSGNLLSFFFFESS